MADIVSRETRSRMMSGIRCSETQLEIAVRSALHREGFRFRKNQKDLPGKPDIVLRRFNSIIFVNGCFWHAHECSSFRWPKSRSHFWKEKLRGNRDRDERNLKELSQLGWRTAVVWGCSITGTRSYGLNDVVQNLSDWLRSDALSIEMTEKSERTIKDLF